MPRGGNRAGKPFSLKRDVESLRLQMAVQQGVLLELQGSSSRAGGCTESLDGRCR